MSARNGIPDTLTLEAARSWVQTRISPKRFAHTEGVALVARQLAERAGVDPFVAELAGLLHDACKEMKAPDLVARAKEYGLPLDEILEKHGHLLHGPVAAEVVKRELSVKNDEFYRAIAEHTLGAVPMSAMSKVVYLADCLESSRPASFTDPIWNALNGEDKFDLDAAIVVACDEGLKYIIEDRKPIHPTTVAVRNFYLLELHDNGTKRSKM